MLEKAILLAVKAHSGQKDKADSPYILHPLRVMQNMDTESEMIVAVLHDVLEDTEITADDLRNNSFSEEILDAVQMLTKQEGEEYQEFIERIKQNPIARKVKLADIEDNMDIKRFKSPEYPTEKDIERLKRYYLAWKTLTEKKRFLVVVEENFRYHNRPERYVKGAYQDCEAAIAVCKKMIDDFLLKIQGVRKKEEELWEYYMKWGEEPWVFEEKGEEVCMFSSRDYARERVKALAIKEKE